VGVQWLILYRLCNIPVGGFVAVVALSAVVVVWGVVALSAVGGYCCVYLPLDESKNVVCRRFPRICCGFGSPYQLWKGVCFGWRRARYFGLSTGCGRCT
jgi:hypothetical protein